MLFNDTTKSQEIARATNPRDAKQLGRKVKNFNLRTWQANLLRIAELVVYTKFKTAYWLDVKVGQVPLSRSLKDTFLQHFREDTIFAEFVASDRVWGTGISMSCKTIHDIPAEWTGTNVLGWALMKTMHRLRREHDDNTNTPRKRGAQPALVAPGRDKRQKHN